LFPESLIVTDDKHVGMFCPSWKIRQEKFDKNTSASNLFHARLRLQRFAAMRAAGNLVLPNDRKSLSAEWAVP